MKKLAGSSKIMLKLKEDILDYSQSDAFVLIEGETGLVKHLLRTPHAVSQNMARAVITVHCSAYDEIHCPDDYLDQYKKAIIFTCF